MPKYANGYIPNSVVSVLLDSGVNTAIGYWEHRLTPITALRHRNLVNIARRRTGKTLRMGDGWSAYRPYSQQVAAEIIYGKGAATPGTSSHGGSFEGRDSLAMDYSNWGEVYGWNQGAFFADVRAAGLTPGMIMKSRGYPDEPWHVVDFGPYDPMPAGSGSTPFPTEQEDDMGNLDNTEANYQTFATFLQRALRFDVRPNGMGATGALGSTLWERLTHVENAANKSAITPAQIKAIADATAAQIKQAPAAEIDYDAIAKAVGDIAVDVDAIATRTRAEFAKNPVK